MIPPSPRLSRSGPWGWGAAMIWAEAVIPMAAFAFATSATPGPVNVISAMSGARFGMMASLPFVLGATASFVAMLVLIGLGFQSVFHLIQTYARWIALMGAGYLLFLAFRIAADRTKVQLSGAHATRPGFFSGIVAQITNPKAWIVSLSAISLYIGPYPDGGARLAIFAALFFVICAAALSGWVILGAIMARFSGNVAIFNRIMAIVLAASVVPVVVQLW